MPQITIEGSRITPSVVLAPGARKTVALTPRIRELLRRGYVIQIGAVVDDGPQPSVPVLVTEPGIPAPVASAPAEVSTSVPTDSAPVVADVVPPTDEHPPYNADRAVWATFLDGLQPAVPYVDGDGRDDLINRWQQSVGGG